MTITANQIVGAIKLTGLSELQCITNPEEFAQALARAMVVEIPNFNQGVHVGPTEPSSPTTAGIWVKTDNAGTFLGFYVYSEGAWIAVDLGGCAFEPVSSGVVLVCDSGVSKPLSGTSQGQVLTLDNTPGGNAIFLHAPYTNITGVFNNVSLGGQRIDNAIKDFTSVVVDIPVTNNSPYLNMDAVLTCVGHYFGTGVFIDNIIDYSLFAQVSIDGGAYTQVALLLWSESASRSNLCHQLSFSVPLALLGLNIPPGGTSTVHIRLKAHYNGIGTSYYEITSTGLGASIVSANK